MGRSLHLVHALVDRMQEYYVWMYVNRVYYVYTLHAASGKRDLGVTGNTNSGLAVVLRKAP